MDPKKVSKVTIEFTDADGEAHTVVYMLFNMEFSYRRPVVRIGDDYTEVGPQIFSLSGFGAEDVARFEAVLGKCGHPQGITKSVMLAAEKKSDAAG